jgi:hypothetical protein
MSAPTPFDAAVEQILTGKAARQVRSAAARGALPLTRSVLAQLYLHLRTDEDEEIRIDAERSLSQLDQPAILEILGEPNCPAAVLQHYAEAAAHDEAMAEKVAFHANSPDEAMLLLASAGNSTVVELLLTNHERLLTVGGLLDLLMANTSLQPGQRARILEVLERAVMLNERAARRGEGEAQPGEDDDEVRDAARLLSVDVGELLSGSEIVDSEEFEQAEDPVSRDAFKRIVSLNTAAKAILAMKGGREERAILIRDTNKVVSLGVLKNPRLTETEIEKISNMRNVSDEVLRIIGTNRDWSKNYVVAQALVLNPRTPPGISTNFVARLNSRDLKNLARSRDVPELIRRMAKRTITQRSQPARGPKGR